MPQTEQNPCGKKTLEKIVRPFDNTRGDFFGRGEGTGVSSKVKKNSEISEIVPSVHGETPGFSLTLGRGSWPDNYLPT